MSPIFLYLLFSCSFNKIIPKNNPDVPLTGSFCFDGFIRNFLEMNCDSRGKGSGPYGTEIFICRRDKEIPEYFIMSDGHSTISDENVLCSDGAITISYYRELGI